ncbi:BLUF domain-containing protein [Marinobacter sp. CHS3-4]|uniref:BLUF domain-containing protein n=1 Tax=Marinobacter sp. CHS3-4 TaxID=3045174 RepID=UPI0024B4B304|nr:BLUF domain-containing protein [Marinobacter sp. CHS3-4]MDI9244835.1 BLUF domain-containing protein [Marinobacter sp. CHS3-4]
MSLIRLAYASEATFREQPVEQGVEPNVARILMTSRRNNARREIVGGLYYGDGFFFQYLEGEENAVNELYDRIAKDDRHRSISTLVHEPLSSRSFSNWSMKYVPLSSDVRKLLEKHDMTSFQPLSFNRELCEEMIDLIRASSEQGQIVNHDTDTSTARRAESGIKWLGFGLLVAAIGVVGALAYASTTF